MPKEVTQLKVFVSCPGDVEAEKQVVQIVCEEINQDFQDRCNVSLLMVEWRKSVIPQFGPRPQQIINEQIGEYDVFIGILWKRFGTPPGATNPNTGEDYQSGTEEEFELAYERWKQNGEPLINFYFKQAASSIPSLVEMESLQKVLKLKDRLRNEYRGWVVDFNGELDFERTVRRFLQKVCFHIGDELAKKKPELTPSSIPVEKQFYEDVRDYLPRRVCAASEYNSSISTYLLKDKTRDLLTLIKGNQHLVLLSDAGAGKTTELKRLAAYYSQQETPYYPYWVSLNKYVNQSIPELLPTNWAQVPDERLMLIFDGLDEIESKNKNDAIRQIELFSEIHPTAHIIVSCRANFYNTELKHLSSTLSGFSSFILLDLAPEDIDLYLNSKLGGRTEAFLSIIKSENLNGLLRMPFYLIRLVQLFLQDSRLPETKADLFEELLKARFELDESHFRTTIELEAKRQDIFGTLQEIALVMESLGRNYISDTEYKEIVPDASVRELLKYCTAWKRGPEEPVQWQFDHNNFQEYLAARALSKQSLEIIKSFISFAPDFLKIIPSWTNTLSFLVSILDKESHLFSELLSWILAIEPELAVKFEANRLDNETRMHIFTSIFNEYKEKKIWIDRHKYEYRELARFGQSDEACEFLISEAENANHYTTLGNAIELLGHSNIHSSQKPRLTKLLVQQAMDGTNEYIQYRALLALAALRLNSQEVIKRIVPALRTSKNDWIRSGLYYFLYNSDFLDENIDVFLEGIKYVGRIVATFGDESTTSRLMDESWHLSKGLEKVSSPQALMQVFSYFESNPEELQDSHLSGFFPAIIRRAVDYYPVYPSLFDSILNLTIALLTHGNEEEVNLLSQFFDATKTRMFAFQQVFSKQNDDGYAVSRVLAFLADTDCLEYYAQQYENHNLTNDDVWQFQFNLGFLNHPLSLQFNQLINEKSGNKFLFQPAPAITHDHRLKKEEDINLLFNKPAFLDEIKQIFDQEGKSILTQDDLLNVRRASRRSAGFPNIVQRTLYRMAENEAVSMERALERLEKNWEWFCVGSLYEYLSNNAQVTLSSDQIDWIANWCYQHLSEIDFKTALVKTEKGESSTSHLAVWLWYFLRKFNLNYPKHILLDLLSFDWVEGHQMGGIGYLEERLSKEDITGQILENLRVGIQSDDVLRNHIEYCKKRGIAEVIPFAFDTARDKNRNEWVRELAIETVDALSSNASNLESLLPEITDSFKWSVIKRLIQRQSPVCIPYLRDILERGEEQEQLKAAIHLIELQDLEGLKFYVQLVEKEKKYVGKSFDRSPLHSVQIADSIPLLIKLLTLSYQEGFERGGFYSLDRAVMNSLETVALQSDDAYQSVRRAVLDFIDTMSKIIEGVTFLHYFLDNLERSYYTRKSQNLTLSEALSRVKSLVDTSAN